MFKKMFYAVVVVVIAVSAFVMSCSNNSVTGPDSFPREAGFEISNLKYSTTVKQDSRGESYLLIDNISVDYRGAQKDEHGITVKGCKTSVIPPSSTSGTACHDVASRYNTPDGTYQVNGNCKITKQHGTTVDGTTDFSIKLFDGNMKTSNTLKSTISVKLN